MKYAQLSRTALVELAKTCQQYFPAPYCNIHPVERIDRRRLRRMLPEALWEARITPVVMDRLAEVKEERDQVIRTTPADLLAQHPARPTIRRATLDTLYTRDPRPKTEG